MLSNRLETPLTLASSVELIEYFSAEDLAVILKNENSASANPWSEADFLSSLKTSHHCLALKRRGEYLGHCVISEAADEAELLILAIAKPFQQQGLATKFLKSLLSVFSNRSQQFFLEVRESNFAAIALYEKLGFNCVGERPNYYPSVDNSGKKTRENALIYAAELTL